MEEEGARHSRLVPGGGGADLISALPEDLLLQVLRRLGCARAAARTSLLSRPWRGLWTRLPDLIFHDVSVLSILAALRSLPVDPGLSLLDITFTSLEAATEASLTRPELREKLAAGVPALLHAASGLSPLELRLTLANCLERADADLPGFHRATSIQLHAHNLRLALPPRSTGAFPKLQKLTLWGCCVDVAALVLCCPCLRVLRVNEARLDAGINIQSDSLQQLSVRTKRLRGVWTDCINVDAPMLKQLAVSISTGTDLSVSVIAPILEKLSWECSYDTKVGPDIWSLSVVRVYPAEALGKRVVTCLQLSNVYVLSLLMTHDWWDWFAAQLNLVQQIEKHLVTDFSILDLTIGYDHAMGSSVHVFGPFVLHLLEMHRIRTATRRLQINFLRPKVKKRCPVNCSCDEPKNWRSKNISLVNLEEVEIEGFDGEDHEFDLLKVIFSCAPMLKRMAIRTSNEVRTSNDQRTKIQDVFKLYPFVECKLRQY